jgi:hypothetical protein
MRHIAVRTALATPWTGFSDSAAAIVTVSRPPYANTEASSPITRPSVPAGRKPPLPVRLAVPGASTPGSRPATANAPSSRNAVIAKIFSAANQNSVSPKLRTATRFVRQKSAMKAATHIHGSVPGIHFVTMSAAAVASVAMATHSSTQ